MTLLTQPSPAETPQTPTIPLLGQSLAELTEWVQQQGQPAYRGKQLHDWIYQKGVRSLSDISVFPKQWRSELESVLVGRSTLHYRSPAPDGTVKFLLRLADGNIIETVGIPTFREETRDNRRAFTKNHPSPSSPLSHPSLSRLTVCVSSQVGCPMACDFCATGKGGFLRNLATHEIVDQVLTVQEDFQQRVSNIVFMGMGEPLLNTDHVLSAVRCLNQDIGIGQRQITISTVGIPGHIRRLAAYNLQATLAVSLHASNQEIREQLIPSARRYPLEALLEECRDYVRLTGRRVSFEYILLAGLNDCPEHAIELAGHLRGFQSHVNLIPYNPIKEVDYKRPDSRRIQAFVNALKAHHIAVSVRRSRGLQADAACGQLRASEMK
ncbi:23S rRNA (adenine(2503)-C(2))-methyltransferase RlmN [Leptothermofonsia sichuanensis E412]|uniref:23S rRNA (adenine(2503)-C(2))-methyltransferase RlmN n=1 Tax=Leptothermofonsia sichuanensis TaxID=2917832 RepID=UPI001CA623A2|nr:23S rRNA (adenine(2503)-C(2))-methyltransferase RlmN [Leptothermofonsia sichuanensis]QZZ20080.1 23S rRNA (adenine(2503)-C(2))-methyltransferase RlmN [Leptothermofonsia sichuanensis E412]